MPAPPSPPPHSYCCGHVFTNWSFWGVEASFAHTIKALEPAFTVTTRRDYRGGHVWLLIVLQVVVSACMGAAVSRSVVLSTLPIVFGVWLASVAEVAAAPVPAVPCGSALTRKRLPLQHGALLTCGR